MTIDYHDLKQQAETLRQQERFSEALPLYDKLWNAVGDNKDVWIGWRYAQCLRKLGRSEDALEICRQVYQIDSEFDRNNNLYGWCVYDTGIRQPKDKVDEKKLLKAAEAITTLTQQGEYSPYEMDVFAVVEHFESYKNTPKPIPYDDILMWLDKLDPTTLSKQPSTGSDGKSYASSKEKWYRSRAKALLELQHYADCVEVCSEALAEISPLHNDFDVWFRWYRANSLVALGKAKEALADLEYVMERKSDWWVVYKYAQALHEVDEIDNAISYAAKAALPAGGLGFRWELFLDLGNMLAEAGQHDVAIKHVFLAAAIRQEEGWKSVAKLQTALEQMNLSEENLPQAKILHRELQPFWKSVQPKPRTTHKGYIIRIHANGKSGNIRVDSTGAEHFFGMRSYKGDATPEVGMRVMFNLREQENKKTGKLELHAVDIYPDS